MELLIGFMEIKDIVTDEIFNNSADTLEIG